MKPGSRLILATALLVALAPAAGAHPGTGPDTGFCSGLAHPFSGWDHLLAMLAVGYWAAQMRARLLLPAAFVGAMMVGALAGHLVGPVPGMEQAIAATVLALGLMIARRARLPAAAGAALVGAFALLHGAAHGAEMPATAGAAAYGCGFVLATALLLGAGVAAEGLATLLRVRRSEAPGWAVAAAGLALLLMTSGVKF